MAPHASLSRGPLQGVGNIIRFNWPMYASALGAALLLVLMARLLPAYGLWLLLAAGAVLAPLLWSLVVSWYVYDAAGLYKLAWLDSLSLPAGSAIANVNAGFDETSALLAARYPDATLQALDFYNPAQHTEASIKRARRAYRPYPGTLSCNTTQLPLPDGSQAAIFVLFAAHEIRQPDERAAFFQELKRCLAPGGRIVVAEHLRDAPNFMAYTLGFMHFLPLRAWHSTFSAAGLQLVAHRKHTPFVSIFTLQACA